ncbi:MAG: hypothetical protein JKP92_07980 [Alphaproteobacteria bacterium]|jgi:hypothetical protein|nr:hypothetical protein [Alphaproteobacteria bacterium]
MTDNDTPPCPFCGLKEDIYSIIDGDFAAICCLGCGARGPYQEIIRETAKGTPIEDAEHDAIMRAAWAWARRAR